MAKQSKAAVKPLFPNTRLVSEAHRQDIAAFEQQLVQAKIALAHADMSVAQMESARQKCRGDVQTIANQYQQRLSDIASAMGLNIAEERWTYDPAANTFSKNA